MKKCGPRNSFFAVLIRQWPFLLTLSGFRLTKWHLRIPKRRIRLKKLPLPVRFFGLPVTKPGFPLRFSSTAERQGESLTHGWQGKKGFASPYRNERERKQPSPACISPSFVVVSPPPLSPFPFEIPPLPISARRTNEQTCFHLANTTRIGMTLEGFTALNHERKMEAALTGVCIAGRSHEGHLVLLYQMSAFYVEVWYNKVHHFISDLVAFDSTDNLAPYLKQINIADLLPQ